MLHRLVGFAGRVGQIVAVLLGFAALLGLVVGPAAIGLAAVGKPILAGEANSAAGKATSLVAGLADPVLRLANKGPGPALALEVKAGRPPLTVPKDAGKASNLNADELDGFDAAAFVRVGTPTYIVQNGMNIAASGTNTANTAVCDGGDRLLTGGVLDVTDSAVVTDSFGADRSWVVAIRRVGSGNASAEVRAVCLDFGAPHDDTRRR